MRALLGGSLVLAALFLTAPVAAQQATAPAITAPAPGQVVQGPVAIAGTTGVPNFASAELDFGYASDATNTWFLIQSTSQAVSNAMLASWDTSTISDGDYVLRLRVYLQDGTSQDVAVTVKVRNYTSLPTASPTVAPTALVLDVATPLLAAPSETPTPVPPAPSTPLPPNPAAVTTNEVYSGLWRGGLVVGALFILMGLLLYLRQRS